MEIESTGTDSAQIQNLPVEKLLAVIIERSKTSTLGALVKGIIHNLNGSLQILSMRMELLQRLMVQKKGDATQAAREQVEQCLMQIDQFRGLLEGLMRKSIHDEQEELQLIQVNDLLEEALDSLYHNLFFKHQIKVTKIFSSALPPIKGRYSDLSHGFWNILQNAIEAMEDSPTKDLTLITETNGPQVRITIKDTGCGIPEKIIDALFQPFFSTKKGKHPGLGLFVAKALFRPYAASFSVSSCEGETIFSVYLPTSVARGN